MDFLDNTLPDKCANLIIADPPYYRTKGDFDFIWGTFNDYLKDVEKWAAECKRLLADNGTLFWYGSAKKIAYSQIILDKYFNLESNITIHIFDRQTNKITIEEARSFINTTEHLLMYSNKTGKGELQNIEKEYIAPRNPFAIELKKARIKSGLSIKTVAEYGHFYGNINHGGTVTNWERGYNIPSKEQWELLCKYLPIERTKYNKQHKEYEELRKEYEELRRPFNPIEEYKMNVLRISQEGHITGKYDHETVKPEKLTRILINTCSRKNDLVLVPFAGSGTECAMAAKEGRKFIGFDIEKRYVEMSQKRIKTILNHPQLF